MSTQAAHTWLHQIDPYAFQVPAFEAFGRQIGPIGPHWYGVMYLVAFALAWWLGTRRVRQGRLPGVSEQAWGDLLFYGMVGVVLGGRLGYILFYGFDAWLSDPLSLLRVWEGGMSFHGGLIGVLIAAAWWCRAQRMHFFDVMDFVAPLVPAGLGMGRIGNFIGAELWGRTTDGSWGVVFPRSLPPELQALDAAALRAMHETGALDVFARHPSQLYQAFLEGVAMFALLWWFSSRPRPRYAVSGMFALLYGAFRILVEFVREPDAHLGYLAFGWVTMGQVLSLPLVALGLFLLWRSHTAPVLQPVAPPPPAAKA